MGKWLAAVGVLLVVAGGVLVLVGRYLPGGMPGDIVLERPGFSFSFPIVTCIVVSIVLSIVANLFLRR